MARVFSAADVDNMIQRYRSGETQGEIAAIFDTYQATVSRILLRSGAAISRSEAMRRRLARMTPDQRLTLSEAAHEAVRGMTRAESDLVKRAATKQTRESHATAEERDLARSLHAMGADPVVVQEAVGKYNLDIGAFPVAVELFGGGWHAHGAHRARLSQRVKDLADRGWNLLIVWSHNGIGVDIDAVSHDAIAYRELTSSDPSFRRQYRVIRGNGQFIAAGCVDDDELTLVPTGIRGVNSRR